MAKGTGLVKSRDRYHKLILAFPDRADFYREQIKKVEDEIAALCVCRRCGRPLKNAEAVRLGYGKECQSQTLAEAEAHLNDKEGQSNTGT